MQAAAKLTTGDLPIKCAAEGLGHTANLFAIFVDEFKPVVLDSGGLPCIEVCAALLCLGTEDGIAAADIGHHRVFAALVIA